MVQPGLVTEVVIKDTVDSPPFIPPLEPGSQAEFGGGWCWMGVHWVGSPWDNGDAQEVDLWDSNVHTQAGDDGSNVLLLPAAKDLISSLVPLQRC